jgi:hypothetical protein
LKEKKIREKGNWTDGENTRKLFGGSGNKDRK